MSQFVCRSNIMYKLLRASNVNITKIQTKIEIEWFKIVKFQRGMRFFAVEVVLEIFFPLKVL